MSLRAFPPLEFYEIVWEGEVLVLLRMFGKIVLWIDWSRAFVLGNFLITASISLGVICLFRFPDSSWFSFGRLYVSGNLSISSRLSSLLVYSCSYIFLQYLYFFGVNYSFLFLILFIWTLSLSHTHFLSLFLLSLSLSLICFWWIWLKVCQSCSSFHWTSS